MRVNGKIRARDVRVIGPDGKQLGVYLLNDALGLARQHGVDLVEISPNAVPPVCRLVEIGKFRYELAKKEKESKKHQHASTVKEVQLSPRIDPHDLGIKVMHAVDFLCEDMKVKVALKFRGREMAHTEVGFEVINKFIAEITPYGHPDFQPKLVGRAINLMVSPHPRAKRAKNPRAEERERELAEEEAAEAQGLPKKPAPATPSVPDDDDDDDAPTDNVPVGNEPATDGLNNPFAGLEIK